MSALDEQYPDRSIIGFIEPIIVVKSKKKMEQLKARIDSGATKSSIDTKIVKKLGLGPVIGETIVTNAHGAEKRKFIEVTIVIAGKTITEVFTVANREKLRYPVLIGRNILKKGFLIDPNRQIRKIPKEQVLLKGFLKNETK